MFPGYFSGRFPCRAKARVESCLKSSNTLQPEQSESKSKYNKNVKQNIHLTLLALLGPEKALGWDFSKLHNGVASCKIRGGCFIRNVVNMALLSREAAKTLAHTREKYFKTALSCTQVPCSTGQTPHKLTLPESCRKSRHKITEKHIRLSREREKHPRYMLEQRSKPNYFPCFITPERKERDPVNHS